MANSDEQGGSPPSGNIRNGVSIPDGEVVRAQVCIVGSGPAGVTAAWHLKQAGIDVVLIEGSRWNGAVKNSYRPSWPDKAKLYAGQTAGLMLDNEPDFPILPSVGNEYGAWERERLLGGTSTHWGGQSRPLSPITFDARPGYAGWPITADELAPWYAQAVPFCNLYADAFGADYWAGVLQAQVPTLDGFDIEMYQFIGGDFLNFAGRTFPDDTTLATCGVDVIINATLLGIEQESGRVQRLRVASMQMDLTKPPAPATTFFIEADVVVLACGAVENARQLLLSGVGNGHDQVGRYFMCHPLSGGGMIRILQPYLDDAESRLMDGQDPQGPWNAPDTGVRVSGRFVPDADTLLREGIGACWFWAGGGQYYFEMAPNPDSRVMLSDQVDPVFGQPQALIDWQLSDLDQRTYEVSTSLFLGAVAARGGQAWAADWNSIRSSLVVNGHHIGTTRMSALPEDGVVDVDLRVHGVDNLYVAGSSVFPSTGISNPTFTIITLSIRLADHLAALFGKTAAASHQPGTTAKASVATA